MTNRNIVFPWTFLLDPSSPTIPVPSKLQSQKASFAKILSNSCDIVISKLPKPYLKGDTFSIKISVEEY
ncbi:hypothetical protein HKD37_01G000969 [Glycine soja]